MAWLDMECDVENKVNGVVCVCVAPNGVIHTTLPPQANPLKP